MNKKKISINFENTLLKISPLRSALIRFRSEFIWFITCVTTVTIIGAVCTFMIYVGSIYIGDKFINNKQILFYIEIILMLAVPFLVANWFTNKTLIYSTFSNYLPVFEEYIYIHNDEIFVRKLCGRRRNTENFEEYYYIKKVTEVKSKIFTWTIVGEGTMYQGYNKTGSAGIEFENFEVFEMLYKMKPTPIKIEVGKFYNKNQKEQLLNVLNIK